MIKRLPEAGEKVVFEIVNPNWKNPIEMEGIVKASSTKFGGTVCLEKGSVCNDEFIVRLDNVK